MSKQGQLYAFRLKTYYAKQYKSLIEAIKREKLRVYNYSRVGNIGTFLNPSELPGLLSIGYWDILDKQDWGLTNLHSLGVQIDFLSAGQHTVYIGGKKYKLNPGALAMSRPRQTHGYGDPFIGPGRLYWINFDPGGFHPHQKWKWPDWFVLSKADTKKFTKLLSQNESPVWMADKRVGLCFKRIGKVVKRPKSSIEISRLAILINELFLNLFLMLNSRRITLNPDLTSTQRTVEIFLKSIKDEIPLLLDEWTIKRMANHCEMGVTHFTDICKRITNMTPMQYLSFLRTAMAANMLREDMELSITRIGFECGFNSSQYFATVFKRFKGCSPREYRLQQKEINTR